MKLREMPLWHITKNIWNDSSKEELIERFGIIKETKSIRSKELTAPMNVYSRYLTELQRPAQPGTKLEFLIIKGNGKSSVGARYRPTDTNEEIDYLYYHGWLKHLWNNY